MKNKFFIVVIVILTFIPLFFVDAAGLIPCGDLKQGEPECNFSHFMQVIQNVMKFLITISASIAAALFAYAGILYITAAGDTGKISKAHQIFKSVAIGFFIILVAWLIVETVVESIVDKSKGSELLKVLEDN